MLDLVPPDPDRLLAAARAIAEARQEGPVLIYCVLGLSRSACVIATRLAMTGRAGSVGDAIERVRGARPRTVLGGGARQAIAEAVEHAR